MKKENKTENPSDSKWLEIKKAIKYESERELLKFS